MFPCPRQVVLGGRLAWVAKLVWKFIILIVEREVVTPRGNQAKHHLSRDD
jgi:hypothetical protein